MENIRRAIDSQYGELRLGNNPTSPSRTRKRQRRRETGSITVKTLNDKPYYQARISVDGKRKTKGSYSIDVVNKWLIEQIKNKESMK